MKAMIDRVTLNPDTLSEQVHCALVVEDNMGITWRPVGESPTRMPLTNVRAHLRRPRFRLHAKPFDPLPQQSTRTVATCHQTKSPQACA
jgi:hypothetical protein